MSLSAKKKLVPCKNFAQGKCSFGPNCHFAHNMGPDMGGGGFLGGGAMGGAGMGMGPAHFSGNMGVGPAYYQAMGQSPLADYSNFNGSRGSGEFTVYIIFGDLSCS